MAKFTGSCSYCFLFCIILHRFTHGILSEPTLVYPRSSKVFANNNNIDTSSEWEKVSDIVKIQNKWLSIIGERLRDDGGNLIDYWRVEKDHSAVILTQYRGQLVFPKPSFRPGVGKRTLDFPGGRIPSDKEPISVVASILQRELGVDESDIVRVEALNSVGWPVNSSFSNQCLYAFSAVLRDEAILDNQKLHPKSYSVSKEEIQEVFSELTCLQCRMVLSEWLHSQE